MIHCYGFSYPKVYSVVTISTLTMMYYKSKLVLVYDCINSIIIFSY